MSNERANTPQDGRPPRRIGALWHHPDFLKLWAGETVSLVGSQVTILALPLTAVILLKATSVQLGLLYAAGFAPFLFVTLFAGVWVDHHRRRPLLIATNIGRAVLLSLIPVLAVMGWLRIEDLYVIAALVGCLTVVFYLAFQALLPILVQRDHLVEGNSKLSASQSIAEISGPGLAGVLVQLVTAPIAMVAALGDVPLLILPFITRPTTGALLLLLCAFFLQGIGLTGCNVHVDSIRQALIPDRLRGSANASYRLLVSGALPVGALLGGFLGAWIGLQLTLLVGAVGLLSTWLWIVFSAVPRLRRLPTMSDEISPSALEKPAHNWHKRARIVDK